jgi:hypothetical protein
MYMRLWIIYSVFHLLLMPRFLDYALMVGQVVFIVISLIHIKDVIKKKCKCQHKKQEYLFYLDMGIIFVAMLAYMWLT